MPIIKSFVKTSNGKSNSVLIDSIILDLLDWDRNLPVTLTPDLVAGRLVITQPKPSPLVVPLPKPALPARPKREDLKPVGNRVDRATGKMAAFFNCPLCFEDTLRMSITDGLHMYHCANCDNGQLVQKLQAMGILS